MTTNRDRAAEVLLEKDGEESFAVATNHDAFLLASEQRRADAQALADAGLLADDDLLAQIDRVRKVADLLDRMAEDNGRLADSLSSEYSKGKQDAYANAAKFIREVTGDSNE